MPWSDTPPPASGWSDAPPQQPGATHTTSGSAGELPPPPGPPPTLQDVPGVGAVQTGGAPSAAEQMASGFFKVPAGLVGGAAQIAQSVTPFANQYPANNPLAQFATSPNTSWWGTAGELAGGIPLGATRLPAAVVGGAMATPSGSATSHLGGAALGGALDLPFRATSAFGNWLRQRAAAQAGAITKDEAPQAAMKAWLHRALTGTNIPIAFPKGSREITGDVLASIRKQVGTKYADLNSKMSLKVTPDMITQLKDKANDIARGLRDPKQAANWKRDFDRYVLRPLTIGKTGVPRDIGGEEFRNYVQKMRDLGHDSFRGSQLDPNGADREAQGRAFRAFADQAENLSTGPDKALRDRMRESYAQISTLDRAAPFEAGSVATPRSILREYEKGFGTDAAARQASYGDPDIAEVERLRTIHETPDKPRIGGGRLIDLAHTHGRGAVASYLATLAANHALGGTLSNWETFLPAWGAMHWGVGEDVWGNLANYAARQAGRAGRGVTKAAGAVPAAYPGLAGARAARALEDAAAQSPTGGVTP